MEQIKKIMSNAAFAVFVLLVFLLLFEQQLVLPAWVQAFGRMHPLLLHLPIGLLLLTSILVFLRKHFESPSFDSLISFLLHVSALTAMFTALMGLFLSREGGYAGQDLFFHKWLGILTCVIAASLIFIQTQTGLFKVLLIAGVVVLTFAGHYGANLTHGENFVLAPLDTPDPKVRILTDSSTLFEAAVDPILERKCYSCHNEQKAKGQLILTSLDQVLKGGKDGKLWTEHGTSLLMQRLLLPPDDKKHMPPRDKPQLTKDELTFLSMWVASGADVTRRMKDYPQGDSLTAMVKRIAPVASPEVKDVRYTFAYADAKKIEALSNPYRTVFQLARTEPALQADFFVRQAFRKESLSELQSVKEQLVSLNLSKMPVGDEDLKTITIFSNLQSLNLNDTDITGKNLSQLQSLEQLVSLSLSGTKITVASVEALVPMKNLKKIFIWNTAISKTEAAALRSRYPAIHWETGFVADTRERLQLSQPLVLNETQVLKSGEEAMLKASLPGTIIRYTTDGTLPDSIRGTVYEKPIPVAGYLDVKAQAFKEGWKSSAMVELIFFREGHKPARAELKSRPHEQYPGDGVRTLTDSRKGSPDFFRDPTWIAFRQEPLDAIFYFDTIRTMQSVTISYARNVGAMTMPPAEIEVWAGPDAQHLTLLKKMKPVQPTEYGINQIEGAQVQFPESRQHCYRILAKPLSRLPAFRKADPKDKGWIMIDEIFFN
jgi:uncharacterized membrane protein